MHPPALTVADVLYSFGVGNLNGSVMSFVAVTSLFSFLTDVNAEAFEFNLYPCIEIPATVCAITVACGRSYVVLVSSTWWQSMV